MIASSLCASVIECLLDAAKILVYQLRGRVPRSNGYRSYRERYVQRTLASPRLIAAFRAVTPLPRGLESIRITRQRGRRSSHRQRGGRQDSAQASSPSVPAGDETD